VAWFPAGKAAISSEDSLCVPPFRYHRPANERSHIDALHAWRTANRSGRPDTHSDPETSHGEPTDLVDVGLLPDLRFAKNEGGGSKSAPFTSLGRPSDIAKAIPIVKDCAGGIADVQVRSRGTIGGSVSAADPNCDWPALLNTLDAEIRCAGPEGDRTIAIGDFITEAYTTALQPGDWSHPSVSGHHHPVAGAPTSPTRKPPRHSRWFRWESK
jgi:carbon-monoxide dehydrogenase medium subunit